jgi:hypothetical protein
MAKYASVHDQIARAIGNTREVVRQNLIAYATLANNQVMNSDPRPLGETITVDGVVGASLDAVTADSVIDFKYWRYDDVAQFALETLRGLSPVGSGGDPHPGLYRDSHKLYLNGSVVSDLSGWQPGDDAYIANLLPYARKIEVGGMQMQVPGTDHVYQQAEQIVNARMGNVGAVQFGFRDLGGDTLAGQFSRGVQPLSRRKLQKDTRAGASMTYPVLAILEL